MLTFGLQHQKTINIKKNNKNNSIIKQKKITQQFIKVQSGSDLKGTCITQKRPRQKLYCVGSLYVRRECHFYTGSHVPVVGSTTGIYKYGWLRLELFFLVTHLIQFLVHTVFLMKCFIQTYVCEIAGTFFCPRQFYWLWNQVCVSFLFYMFELEYMYVV